MDLNTQLTRNVEIGAVRTQQWDVEIVRTDGGGEVRNSRWSAPLRAYEIGLPTCKQDGRDTFDSVMQMWLETEGGTHTFLFYDWIDEELVRVRFASPPNVTSASGNLLHMDTFTLQEVRE